MVTVQVYLASNSVQNTVLGIEVKTKGKWRAQSLCCKNFLSNGRDRAQKRKKRRKKRRKKYEGIHAKKTYLQTNRVLLMCAHISISPQPAWIAVNYSVVQIRLNEVL